MPPPNLNSKDYYEILGCDRKADESALKKAYRKLAVKVSSSAAALAGTPMMVRVAN